MLKHVTRYMGGGGYPDLLHERYLGEVGITGEHVTRYMLSSRVILLAREARPKKWCFLFNVGHFVATHYFTFVLILKVNGEKRENKTARSAPKIFAVLESKMTILGSN